VPTDDVEIRVRRHAALADPVRLAIVDELMSSDRSPVELRRLTGLESNLLAHHLAVLEEAGMVNRSRSSGDGRRRYVHLRRDALETLGGRPARTATNALFLCTRNSARSQLAAALWHSLTKLPADSAGTHPAERVDRRAVAAARRAQLPFRTTAPKSIDAIAHLPPVVVTVCDQAHEELEAPSDWLHWSIPDPVTVGTAAAFDDTVNELRMRVEAFTEGSTRP
jgi:protein-tyrosine-phosphatase